MRQGDDSSPRVYVIHENDAWVVPLRKQFEARKIPFAEWFLDQGVLDLRAAPPPGVFYNRMSASSHTRDHRYAPELTGAVLAWLKRHGRTVVNGERALALEVSKVAQYEALDKFGVETPETLAVVGKQNIAEAARRLGFPLILKHNRAGKGLGVRLFLSAAALDEHLAGGELRRVGRRHHFGAALHQGAAAVHHARRIRRRQIPLCGAGRYLAGLRALPGRCVPDRGAGARRGLPRGRAERQIPDLRGFEHPLMARWQAFLAANDIGIAGVEFIVDENGRPYTYDVNTNTNYNPDAEAKDGRVDSARSGMGAIAAYLGGLLARERDAAAPSLAIASRPERGAQSRWNFSSCRCSAQHAPHRAGHRAHHHRLGLDHCPCRT